MEIISTIEQGWNPSCRARWFGWLGFGKDHVSAWNISITAQEAEICLKVTSQISGFVATNTAENHPVVSQLTQLPCLRVVIKSAHKLVIWSQFDVYKTLKSERIHGFKRRYPQMTSEYPVRTSLTLMFFIIQALKTSISSAGQKENS